MEAQNRLRIVAVSDTHANFGQFQALVEDNIKGDIFICGGDFTLYGRQEYFLKFFSWLDRLQFRHKVVVAGNHQIALDTAMSHGRKVKLLGKYPCKLSREHILAELKKRCFYLEHDIIEIEGIRIFGSPFTLAYSHGAFQYPKANDQFIWNTLPEGIDLLITHSPPLGILDKTNKELNAGSPTLRQKVDELKPKLHIFGHIHQSHGKVVIGPTTFMNVAKKYQIFDWE